MNVLTLKSLCFETVIVTESSNLFTKFSKDVIFDMFYHYVEDQYPTLEHKFGYFDHRFHHRYMCTKLHVTKEEETEMKAQAYQNFTVFCGKFYLGRKTSFYSRNYKTKNNVFMFKSELDYFFVKSEFEKLLRINNWNNELLRFAFIKVGMEMTCHPTSSRNIIPYLLQNFKKTKFIEAQTLCLRDLFFNMCYCNFFYDVDCKNSVVW